jgi:hypothetical protein
MSRKHGRGYRLVFAATGHLETTFKVFNRGWTTLVPLSLAPEGVCSRHLVASKVSGAQR